jgi:hypothetical protein
MLLEQQVPVQTVPNKWQSVRIVCHIQALTGKAVPGQMADTSECFVLRLIPDQLVQRAVKAWIQSYVGKDICACV